MATVTTLAAEPRTVSGTGPVGRLRRKGYMPGIIYSSRMTPEMIQLNAHEFELMLRHHTSENVLLDLKVGEAEPRKVLVRDIQRDHLEGHVLHADFLAVSMDQKLQVTVALVLAGIPVGVSQSGGMLDHLLREVQVECLPGDIIEQIAVDVSGLELGKTILVRDLVVDPKLRIVTDGSVAVACVLMPRLEGPETTAEEGAEGEAPKEPVKIGEEEKEGEAEEAPEEDSKKKKKKEE